MSTAHHQDANAESVTPSEALKRELDRILYKLDVDPIKLLCEIKHDHESGLNIPHVNELATEAGIGNTVFEDTDTHDVDLLIERHLKVYHPDLPDGHPLNPLTVTTWDRIMNVGPGIMANKPHLNEYVKAWRAKCAASEVASSIEAPQDLDQQGQAMQTVEESVSLALDPEDIAILQALNTGRRLMDQFMLEDETRIARKTISKRLKRLRKKELTHRPKGDRGGEAITPDGRKRLEQLHGAH